MRTDDIEDIVERSLKEDLPDITSEAIFGEHERSQAWFMVKQDGVIAGLPAARAVFAYLDEKSRFDLLKRDGDRVSRGDAIAVVNATVRALLAGERTALNLLQRASGIATRTRSFVDAVEGTGARIYDTRKTAPGLRALDKYSVRTGGGHNHRFGLHDMVLIKNNHIDRAGSVQEAIKRVRGHGVKAPMMVEVRNMRELQQALAFSPDYILLDNMGPEMLSQSVTFTAGRVPLEASGGVTLENVRAIAETGVERISVGELTHSVRALDISVKIQAREGG